MNSQHRGLVRVRDQNLGRMGRRQTPVEIISIIVF